MNPPYAKNKLKSKEKEHHVQEQIKGVRKQTQWAFALHSQVSWSGFSELVVWPTDFQGLKVFQKSGFKASFEVNFQVWLELLRPESSVYEIRIE